MDLSSVTTHAVLFGSLVAGIASVTLAKRAANRRIRLLSLSVVLLTFCEASSSLSKLFNWESVDLARSIEILQLTATALTLSFVHLLTKENRERSNADIRLRVLESDLPSDCPEAEDQLEAAENRNSTT